MSVDRGLRPVALLPFCGKKLGKSFRVKSHALQRVDAHGRCYRKQSSCTRADDVASLIRLETHRCLHLFRQNRGPLLLLVIHLRQFRYEKSHASLYLLDLAGGAFITAHQTAIRGKKVKEPRITVALWFRTYKKVHCSSIARRSNGKKGRKSTAAEDGLWTLFGRTT